MRRREDDEGPSLRAPERRGARDRKRGRGGWGGERECGQPGGGPGRRESRQLRSVLQNEDWTPDQVCAASGGLSRGFRAHEGQSVSAWLPGRQHCDSPRRAGGGGEGSWPGRGCWKAAL